MTVPAIVTATAPDGVPEVRAGDDLVALLLPLVDLVDGDVVVVTSKVVSKTEGRVVAGPREDHLAAETARVVARRGPTTIVRTRHGLTLAAAGIDGSNVALGSSVLLPLDPDASARRLRESLLERTGRNVGVVVTDTAGRAWREGQTDIAVGAAGLVVAEDFAGRLDAHGNELAVTAPAVADEIAGLAELAQGKLGGRPFAVVRGRADLVLAPGEHGPGAVALVRAEGADLFGYGAREAVTRAVGAAAADVLPFGAAVDASELVDVVVHVLDVALTVLDDGTVSAPADAGALVGVLAFAHGWLPVPTPAGDDSADLRFARSTP
ncbi:coenzyme F420-0:L-glutamate ligase [Nocardioides sp.]|uniref:coenzyme F420-0:L-glutamate ligase n=1 Tax=Nocardioides sp. TaxID=35761 RepID=UPI00271D20A1|nr:coenzyme F420-0:L-glutamate ligase [Nocardioides sp.]MDO9456872.1 coenzyme F420-0:L-glutamate ligase [Nocardioides sp.]